METIVGIDQQLLLLLNGSDSLFLDGLMVTLTSGFTWIPLYIAVVWLIIKNNETMPLVMLAIGAGLCCVAVTAGITNLIVKPIIARPRPCNDMTIKYLVDVVYRLSQKDFSFFSAHAANTSGLAVFLILLIRNKILSVFLVVWSLLNCYTRLYLGLHYPADILCGMLFGCFVGFGIYCIYLKLFQKYSANANYVSTQYTSTGYSISDIDVVVGVMVLTFLYALARAFIICLN